ncbi:MAG TPA: hypothetical protein VJ772_06825 [Nitrososphaeraceae archaeon]|jgi:hypothetical protein|nr:hypothetical protein [Nitrososphaeraceae archaeon]
MDESKKIGDVKNNSENNYESVHNAVKKASRDPNFISKVVEQLDTMKFPAYRHQILSFVQNKSSDENAIGLLKSLNDTILFRDKYDVKQGLEQENSELKQKNQISDNTRENLEVQHSDDNQKSKDYPEIPATAMKNYICSFCGKDFQSKDQLVKHQEFEFKDKVQE